MHQTNVPLINQMGETNMYENHETLAKHCKRHGLNVAHARRIMRKTGIDGVVNVVGTYIIDKNAPPIKLPALGKHATARTDGRARYTVWATATELAVITKTVGNDNIINPRETAKQKRAARKAAKNAKNA